MNVVRARSAIVARAVSLLWLSIALRLGTACGDDDTEPSGAMSQVRDGATPAAPAPGHVHTHLDAGSTPPAMRYDAGPPPPDAFDWQLPPGFPRPKVPSDNPMSAEKVELGRRIFYDKRLSDNETQSCASCHQQALAFTDGRATGLGSTGQAHSRGAMSLANVAYAQTLTWSNPLMIDLEGQSVVPIFGDSPIELGMKSVPQVEERFRAIPFYTELFAEAFPGEEEPVTMLNVERALAAFERTILSGSSAYDRYVDSGDEQALSDSAKRGMVFVTTSEDPRFECNHCHGGFAFTDHVTWEGQQTDDPPTYHQTGLYDVDGKGGYPEPNTGVYSVTLDPKDIGMFKAPTLRNIALTAPYMHDGSIATLSDVLDHYSKGGRARHAGRTDALLVPFEITEQEKADVVAFLESLTDDDLKTNAALSDPWADSGP